MPVTNYIWDEENDTLLMETDEAGNTIAEYTHEPTRYGPLISQRRNGQTRHYHYDGQGSARALTDESGTVTDRYTYDAWGNEVAQTGTTVNPFGYKGALGYYANPETNDLYVRARMYHPGLARWSSTDPLSSAMGRIGGYEYGGNRAAILLAASPLEAMAEFSREHNAQESSALPLVPWKEPSPDNRCGIGLYGTNEGEDDEFRRIAEGFAAMDNTRAPVCHPDLIDKLVSEKACCDLLIYGHRGGKRNMGGVVSYCPCLNKAKADRTEACRILPDTALLGKLAQAFQKNCKQCRIIMAGCQSALYAKPLIDMAKTTKCIVCGQSVVGGGSIGNLPHNNLFRCVDPQGNQVKGLNHTVFEPGHDGDPPAEILDRQRLCRDLVDRDGNRL